MMMTWACGNIRMWAQGDRPVGKDGATARRRPNPGNISYSIASAEALPLSDDHANLIFMSMVYHLGRS
jgi:hypothetical protein